MHILRYKTQTVKNKLGYLVIQYKPNDNKFTDTNKQVTKPRSKTDGDTAKKKNN